MKWFCAINNETKGPFSKGELEELLKRGELTSDTLVCNKDDIGKDGKGWVKASETALADIFPPPIPTPDVEWFYMSDGEKKGPFKEDEMRRFAEDGTIKADTRVCNDDPQNSARGWTVASKSELSDLYPSLPPSVGSRKTAQKFASPVSFNDVKDRAASFFKNNYTVGTQFGVVVVHDKYLWGMIGATVAAIIISSILFNYFRFMTYVMTLLSGALTLWLADKDMKLLDSAGMLKFKRSIGFICAIFTPVYLYRRASCTGQKRTHFFAWIVLWIINIVIFSMFQYPIIAMEQAAPSLVNQILSEQLDMPATCTKVSVIEKLSRNKYEGVALLNNGNALKINLSKGSNDMIYVEIPYDQFLQ
jgi:hypothetical protein